jgi:hypothetical protein
MIKNAHRLVINLEGTYYLEDLGMGRRIIFKCILKKFNARM